jgi:hypothetical protein
MVSALSYGSGKDSRSCLMRIICSGVPERAGGRIYFFDEEDSMLRKIMVVICLAAISAGSAFAAGGSGMANSGHGPGYPTGGRLTYNICVGAAETITGKVVNFGWPINGLEINTGSGNVTVYGIGPDWYWDDKGVDRPEIGETVTAMVSAVNVSNYKVILSLTLGDTAQQTIQLRDTSTCQPLWRGGRR